MAVIVEAVVEYNEGGCLIYAGNFPGAYTRGGMPQEALGKFSPEINAYCLWAYETPAADIEVRIAQQYVTALNVSDADSDVLFNSEREPLTQPEYGALKALALKSALDFQILYNSVPDKSHLLCPPRQTFYGDLPNTAESIYRHANGIASYYAGEIGATHQNVPAIAENRLRALSCIEALPGYLTGGVFKGSYDELWSLRKVLRRFIWHDRLHARAMQRHAAAIWGAETIADPYYFNKGGMI